MLSRTFAMALGIVGAITTSQLPEFTQQYRQRLGGAIDELREVVRRFDDDAKGSGLTRGDALRRLQAGDEFLRRRGESEAQAKIRLDNLLEQQQAMQGAGSFGRIGTFIQGGDSALAARTFHEFEPAMPVTSEGIAAAALGFIGGYFLVRIMVVPFAGMSRRRETRRA